MDDCLRDPKDPQFGNTFAGYAEAFTIFAKYSPGTYLMAGQHDQIFAAPGFSEVISEEDRARLKELGWRIDEENEGFVKFT